MSLMPIGVRDLAHFSLACPSSESCFVARVPSFGTHVNFKLTNRPAHSPFVCINSCPTLKSADSNLSMSLEIEVSILAYLFC